MMTLMTIAPILFLLCVAAGVAVMSRAQRGLTVEEKAAVFDAAPKRQAWLLVAMAVVMAAFTLPTLHGLVDRGVPVLRYPDVRHVETFATMRSNQAMQRTASQAAFHFMSVCHPRFDSVARFGGLAVADLVSR
jgi:hypothetical protein